jgi:hypothetical protein
MRTLHIPLVESVIYLRKLLVSTICSVVESSAGSIQMLVGYLVALVTLGQSVRDATHIPRVLIDILSSAHSVNTETVPYIKDSGQRAQVRRRTGSKMLQPKCTSQLYYESI